MPRPPLTEFESKGWYLSEEGLALIEDEFDDDKGTQTVDDYIATALHMDLRQLSSKGFRKGDMQPVSTLPSPLVLQLLEVRNVAMPLAHQTDAPRLLRITFTDGGKKKWTGVEYFGAVDCIKLHSVPGTKFLVLKPIEIREQLLLLGPGMLKELGGHVQELVQAWRAGKQFVKRYLGRGGDDASTTEGPPPFVPFKIKTTPIEKEKSHTGKLPKSSEQQDKLSDKPVKQKEPLKKNAKDHEKNQPKAKENEKPAKDRGKKQQKGKGKEASTKEPPKDTSDQKDKTKEKKPRKNRDEKPSKTPKDISTEDLNESEIVKKQPKPKDPSQKPLKSRKPATNTTSEPSSEATKKEKPKRSREQNDPSPSSDKARFTKHDRDAKEKSHAKPSSTAAENASVPSSVPKERPPRPEQAYYRVKPRSVNPPSELKTDTTATATEFSKPENDQVSSNRGRGAYRGDHRGNHRGYSRGNSRGRGGRGRGRGRGQSAGEGNHGDHTSS